MIPWRTIDEALKCAVSDASGLDDVRWKWEPSKIRKPTCINLRRSSLDGVGFDERVRDATPARGAYQVGQRTFRLEVRCESNVGSPDDDYPKDSSDVLGALRTRIRRPAILADLKAAGVAISSIGTTSRIEWTVEKREYSASILEIVFMAADIDADGVDSDVIQHVEIRSANLIAPDDSVAPGQVVVTAP